MPNTSTIIFTPGEVSTYYGVRVPSLKPARGKIRRGPCPIHCGKDNNFVVDLEIGLWFCHSQCGRGGDVLALERALTGADFRVAMAEVCAIVGRSIPDWDPLTREELLARQEGRREAELVRSEADYFAAAAIVLLEQVLEELAPWDSERARYSRLLLSLRNDAVEVYCRWCDHRPEAAAALVKAGRKHQYRLQRLLLAFVKAISTEAEKHAT